MKQYCISIGLGLIAYIAIELILLQMIMLDKITTTAEAFIGIFVPLLIALSFTHFTGKCK